MPDEFIFYISQYGYLAIFLFVFLQEVGAPTPIPNEFVLIFSGYLAFAGTLHPVLVILCALAGDLLAATILYALFYFFGNFVLRHKTRWLPISQHNIEKQIRRIEKHGVTAIIIGRLSPFIRGYVAIICGTLHIKPRQYGFIILATTSLWSCFYITIGYFLGPYWNYVIAHINQLKYVLLSILMGVAGWFIIRFFIKRHFSHSTIN